MFVLDNNFKVVHTLRLRTAQTSIKKILLMYTIKSKNILYSETSELVAINRSSGYIANM